MTALRRDPKATYWIRDPLWGAFYNILYSVLRRLPCTMASALGARLGVFEGYLRRPALQRRIGRCLKILRADLQAVDHASIYCEMWRNVGRVHAEMAVADRLWAAAAITVVNLKALRAAGDSGRPIVFVFPHLGNWELLAIAATKEGIVLNVVYEHLRNRFEDRLARRSRQQLGYRLIPPTRHGARELFAALRKSEAIALALDEFKWNDVLAPAFGRSLPEATNMSYAVRLARRFDALLVPACCVRTAPLAFTLSFGDPLSEPRVSELNALAESWIRAHPEQWYMLWRMLPGGAASSRE